MSHNEVAMNFGTRKINARNGRVYWAGNNVYCRDDIIYSYGGHFPMAKYLGEHPKYGRMFIKNLDKYSSSTSSHQSDVSEHCPGPGISRSVLSKIFSMTDLKMENIFLWNPGIASFVYRDLQTKLYYENPTYLTLGPDDLEPTDHPFLMLTKDNAEDQWSDDHKNFIKPIFDVVHLKRSLYVFDKPMKKSGVFKPHKKQDNDRFITGTLRKSEHLVLKIKRRDSFFVRIFPVTEPVVGVLKA